MKIYIHSYDYYNAYTIHCTQTRIADVYYVNNSTFSNHTTYPSPRPFTNLSHGFKSFQIPQHLFRHFCRPTKNAAVSSLDTMTMSASVPPSSEASSITNSTSDSIPSISINEVSTRTAGTAPRILRIAVGSTNPSKIAAVQQAFGKAVNDAQSLSSSSSSADNDDDDDNVIDNDKRVQLDIQGFSVASGVPDQPYGDQETSQGAKNRAVAAFRAYTFATGNAPHFAVGMEGGLEWSLSMSLSMSTTQTSQEGNATNTENTNDDKNNDDDGHDHDDDDDETGSEDRLLLCMAWMCVYGRRQAFTVDALASEDTITYIGDKKPIFGVAKTASFALPPAVVSLIQDKGMELGHADDQIFGRVNGKHGSGTVGILSKGLINRSAYYEHAILLALVPWFRPDVYPNGLFGTKCH
jgi:non-canonical (house-cleaning) NTP pyrophosphatase